MRYKLRMLNGVVAGSVMLPLMLGQARQPNINLEDYFHLPEAKQDATIIAIADYDANYYDEATSHAIRAIFHYVGPGHRHSLGVNQVDQAAIDAAKQKNTHSASSNTLVGKYVVAKFGAPKPR